MTMTEKSFVIFSLQDSLDFVANGGEEPSFWDDELGWTTLGKATVYLDRQEIGALPLPADSQILALPQLDNPEENKPVILFVQGGILQHAHNLDRYTLVDYDSLESGACPLCNTPLILAQAPYCPQCRFSWEGAEDDQVIGLIDRIEKEKHHGS
jgi:hypothetical protein